MRYLTRGSMVLMFVAWSVAACVLWAFVCLRIARRIGRLPRLETQTPAVPPEWPRLSVLIPACNEGEAIESAVQTTLAQDYPNLEIILINDRSTDQTGEAIERIAATDPRVVALHIDVLPEGWLGKVHALERALEKAQGEWILLTDADVHFRPGLFHHAVAVAVAQDMDHIGVLPFLKGPSFSVEIAICAFAAGFINAINPKEIGDPRSDFAVGVGAFNLARRSAIHRAGGLESIRMEVADDMGFAMLLKKTGGRSLLLAGDPESVSLVWYASIRELVLGLEKNLFATAARYSVARLIAVLVALGLVLSGLLLALALVYFYPSMWLAIAAASISNVLVAFSLRKQAGLRVLPSLFLPFGVGFMLLVLARSAFLCIRRGGIVWRGTTYSLRALREGQRVKL